MLSIAPQGTGGGRSSVLHWNTARIIMAHSMWRLMSIVSPLVAYLPNSYCTCSSAWENGPSPSAAAQHSMDGMHSTEESSIPQSREKERQACTLKRMVRTFLFLRLSLHCWPFGRLMNVHCAMVYWLWRLRWVRRPLIFISIRGLSPVSISAMIYLDSTFHSGNGFKLNVISLNPHDNGMHFAFICRCAFNI